MHHGSMMRATACVTVNATVRMAAGHYSLLLYLFKEKSTVQIPKCSIRDGHIFRQKHKFISLKNSPFQAFTQIHAHTHTHTRKAREDITKKVFGSNQNKKI